MTRQSLCCLALALLFTACPGPTPTPDGGSQAPVLTSLSPTRGPVGGGTVVTLNGTGFADGATVSFGATPATSVTFVSASRVTAFSPPNSVGAVAVTLTNPGGRSSTLASAFTYETTAVARPIAEALVVNPVEQSDTSGAATVSVSVVGHVQVATVTGGAGQGAGVRAEVGFATTVSSPPALADFTWSAATYLGDVDGPASGDLLRDAYSGPVSLAGPTSGTQATYYLAARFSTDDGATWTLADRDGAANGVSQAQLPRVIVSRASVEWCKLGGESVEAPPVVTLRGAAPGPTIFGQVFQPGVTTQGGAGSELRGALGYGAAGSDPSTWTWVDAAFNRDTGAGANDEFMADLPNPGVGAYKFAFRFSHANGPWTYCDADGLAVGGFTEDQAGSLTVQEVGLDSCVLQFPTTLTTYEGRLADPVYGRVYAQGITDGTGAGAGIDGQLGYGPAAAMPDDAAWAWAPNGTFNIDAPGGGDEYQARLTGPAPGTYAYAWRFRLDGGAWTYCDSDGSQNGYQASAAGTLTALPFVLSCRLETVSAFALPSGDPLGATVRVLVPGISSATGPSPNLEVHVGVGPKSDDASNSSLWGWKPAAFAADISTSGEDEFAATVFPAYTGDRAVSARARLGSQAWVYCDLNGSDVGGYEVNQQYDVTVSAHATFDFCNTQAPAFADAGTLIYGQIYEPGLTPDPTTPFVAQLGVGPGSEDPGLSWNWSAATFNVTAGNNNEYQAALPADAGVGRAYAFRYTLDGGAFCYGDLDGSQNGFSGGSNVGTVTGP